MTLALIPAAMCLWAASSGISATPTTLRQATAPATAGQCRTYTAMATDLETNPNAVPPFTLTNTYTSTFNALTNELTTTGTVTYPSVAAFVAEVGVIPPVGRQNLIASPAS